MQENPPSPVIFFFFPSRWGSLPLDTVAVGVSQGGLLTLLPLTL